MSCGFHASRTLLALLLLLLSSCAKSDSQSKTSSHQLESEKTSSPITESVIQHEKYAAEDCISNERDACDQIDSSPAIAEGSLFFAGADGSLYALDITTANKKWRFRTGDPLSSQPVITGGTVYFASGPNVYAAHAKTGKQIWKFKLRGENHPTPVVTTELVYVVDEQTLHALDSRTGRLNWHFRANTLLYSSPVVVGQILYITSIDQHLYAIDIKTGEILWTLDIEGPIYSEVLTSDGIVCVMTERGSLYAVDGITGQEKWSYKAAAYSYVSSIANGLVFIADFSDLYALNLQTGNVEWKFQAEGQVNSHCLSLTDAVLFESYPADSNRRYTTLHSVDRHTGSEKWRLKVYELTSPIATDGDTLYFGSCRSFLAVDGKTGKIKWQYEQGKELYIGSAPSVAGNIVYFTSEDGSVYALNTSTGRVKWRFPKKSDTH